MGPETEQQAEATRLVLRVESGATAGTVYTLGDERVMLGTSVDNTVQLPGNAGVSRRHARIFRKGKDWFIEDSGSTNGTFAVTAQGRHRLDAPKVLAVGERFIIGRVVIARLAGGETAALSENAPAVLQIRQAGSKLLFALDTPDMPTVCAQLPFEQEDRRELNRRLTASAWMGLSWKEGAVEGQTVTGQLAEAGIFLSKHLLPAPVSETLSSMSTTNLVLKLAPEVLPIPWELAWTGGQFLCMGANVSRCLHDPGKPWAPPPPFAWGEKTRVLLITGTAPENTPLQKHSERVLQILLDHRPEWSVELLAGNRATRTEVLNRLEDTGIVYYFGHAEYEGGSAENSAWVLAQGCVCPADFQRLRTPPALVFANGCDTAREGTWQEAETSGPVFSGVASSMMAAGVNNYLGTHWPASPQQAALFATAFFQRLATGTPLATAVRLARGDVSSASPTLLSYALYCHYGP